MRANKSILLCLLMVCALNSNGQQQPDNPGEGLGVRHALMPIPLIVNFKEGRLPINNTFKAASIGYTDERLLAAWNRSARRLENRTGNELPSNFATDAGGASLLINCKGPGSAVASLGDDESYSLEVSDKGASLNAKTVVGAIRGLETLQQLVAGDRDRYFIPAVSIQDRPRFPWRGLLIDVGRHFQSVEVIKHQLDGMAAVKLNVLHWHLTEDQGFRIESRKYPKLHEMGSDGLYYTQAQAREIINYARDRGIRVVPEFDMPGHATSWFVGYPSLASAPGPYKIERTWGIMDPAFDPTNEEVYKFLDDFLGEMASLFPDAYMHIGGDESNGEHWAKNPKIQAFMKEKGIKNAHDLQQYFTGRLASIVSKHGKRMVGWDEIMAPGLPKEVVVQSWRGQASLAEGAKNGYQGILANGYYLDHMLSAAQHYAVDPIAADSGLTDEQAARILGGEASMWTEYVSEETIDSRIWPRLAAIAERLWSPRNVVDVDDMYRRLSVTGVQLEELGLTHNTHADKMLRRLAAGEDVGPLRTLVDVIEPLKYYQRGENHPTTQLSPLTRLVDAAHPESPVARRVSSMVDDLLSDAPRFQANQQSLGLLFKQWRDVYPALEVTTINSPLLADAEPLARSLSEIGLTGLEALAYLSKGMAPTKSWRDARLALLNAAAKPNPAAVGFAIIPSVKQLVVAAAELPELKNTALAEWKKRVKMLAADKQAAPGN